MRSVVYAENDPNLSSRLRLSEWQHLQSLTLHLSEHGRTLIANAVKLLDNVNSKTCKDVTIQFDAELSFSQMTRYLLDRDNNGDLEHIVLGFSRVNIIWAVQPLRATRNSFWTRELNKHYLLCQRGAVLVLKSEIGESLQCAIQLMIAREKLINFAVFPAGHDGNISAFAVSPDSRWVASGSSDSTVIVWDARHGNIVEQWVCPSYAIVPTSLAFSPDSRYLVCGSEDGKATVWDLSASARMATTLSGHKRSVSSCAWSPDGTIIATASYDAAVVLWDARAFEVIYVLDAGSKGFRDRHHIEFSPDGRWLVSACSSDNDSWVWAMPSGTLHMVVKHEYPDLDDEPRPLMRRAAIFNLASTRVATTATYFAVEVWDIETGERLFVSQEVAQVRAVSISPDGSLVLAGLQNGTVKIWDIDAGVELLEFRGHTKAVQHACFSPCGKYIASAADERYSAVLLWRVSDGTCVAELSEGAQWLRFIAFSQDGSTLSTATSDGTVFFYHMYDLIPVDELP